jgi:hypothetical protein
MVPILCACLARGRADRLEVHVAAMSCQLLDTQEVGCCQTKDFTVLARAHRSEMTGVESSRRRSSSFEFVPSDDFLDNGACLGGNTGPDVGALLGDRTGNS